jgi:hypothetical protein
MTSQNPTSASLGELAVRYGLLQEAERVDLSQHLQSHARAGRPTSMAHVLLQRGAPRGTLERILGSAAQLQAVRCDACNQARSLTEFPGRQPLPCPGCGALVIGFAAFAPSDVAPLPADDAEEAGSRTMDFSGVLVPVPQPPAAALDDAETTAEFDALVAPPTPPNPAAPFDSLETSALKPTIVQPAYGASPTGTSLTNPGVPHDAFELPGSAAFTPPSPTIDLPPPTPITIPPQPKAALADLPGLVTMDALELPKQHDMAQSGPLLPAKPSTTRRRRPARTTGFVPVPPPPALWPWVVAIVVLVLVAVAEVVAHALI